MAGNDELISPLVASDKNKGIVQEGSKNATFISAVLMTVNSAVGLGLLALPYAFRCVGLLGGSLTLLGFVVAEYQTLRVIVHCAQESGAEAYPDIVRFYLGPRAAKFFSGVIAVYCFFASTGGFVIVKNVLTPMLMELPVAAGAWWASSHFQVLFAGCLALPLMCLRRITSLSFTAMLSFAAMCFVASVVVSNYEEPAETTQRGRLDSWGPWPSALLAVPNIFVSLQSHIQVPSIFADLPREPTRVRRMELAMAVAYMLIFVLYSTVATFGLMTFHRMTLPNIMECGYDAGSVQIIAARLCLAVTAIFSVPVNHYPAREALWSLASSGDKARGVMPRRFLLGETFVFFAFAVVCACVIEELSTVNDLLALSAGVAVIFVLPGMFLLAPEASPGKLVGTSEKTKPIGQLFCVFGFLTFLMSLYSFIASSMLGVQPPPP